MKEYAAAAARAAPSGGGLPTPVAHGSSTAEGLEAASAAGAPLDELIQLPTYSMARVASETDDFIRRAPMPTTNVSPAAGPMPPPPTYSTCGGDGSWRPRTLTDVYTEAGILKIVGWFAEMEKYEAAGRAKAGRQAQACAGRPTSFSTTSTCNRTREAGRGTYSITSDREEHDR